MLSLEDYIYRMCSSHRVDSHTYEAVCKINEILDNINKRISKLESSVADSALTQQSGSAIEERGSTSRCTKTLDLGELGTKKCDQSKDVHGSLHADGAYLWDDHGYVAFEHLSGARAILRWRLTGSRRPW